MERPTMLIGSTMVDSWRVIERAMVDEPNRWFAMAELKEMATLGTLLETSVATMVYRAAKADILVARGRRGHRSYQLAREYQVGIYLRPYRGDELTGEDRS